MACDSKVLRGIAIDCEQSMGGIKKVWLANYDATATVTVSTDKISAISNTADYKVYNFKKNTATMTKTLNVDPANGINFVQTELVMQFTKMDTTKRVEIEALSLNGVSAIVLDSNGVYWYLGKDEAIYATAGSGQTGQAKTDGNFYSITLTDESVTWPYEIDKSAVADLPQDL